MESSFPEIFQGTSEWLNANGNESDIVISSRVRLARNIAGNHFVRGMDNDERKSLCRRLEDVLVETDIVPKERILHIDLLDDLERQMLVERHLISRDMAGGDGPRSVGVSDDEIISVMVIEEDHLRIQVLQSGFELDKAFAIADRIDNDIEKSLLYSYHFKFGFLTACPTNVGTGLRISVMLHLPALVLTHHINKVIEAGSQMQLAVRGMYGEGTEPLGQFFQISNQITLGSSESEIIERLSAVIPEIIKYENNARQTLMLKDRRRLEDRVWRAWGQLSHARSISSEESLMLLSHLRMGVQLGLLPSLPSDVINELLLYTQPAHLQVLAGSEMDPVDRDGARADLIRKKLEGISS